MTFSDDFYDNNEYIIILNCMSIFQIFKHITVKNITNKINKFIHILKPHEQLSIIKSLSKI